MVIKRGEIWWGQIPFPRGSEPGYSRPLVVVSADTFNRSAIHTVVVLALTRDLGRENAPGNVRLSRRDSGPPHASVANVSQLMTLDKCMLTVRVKRIPPPIMQRIDDGLRLALAR